MTHDHLKERFGYAFVGVGAIALTWSADTFGIIAMASRAFAIYYMLQCLVATSVSRSLLERIGMLALALVLIFIAIFAIPAS